MLRYNKAISKGSQTCQHQSYLSKLSNISNNHIAANLLETYTGTSLT